RCSGTAFRLALLTSILASGMGAAGTASQQQNAQSAKPKTGSATSPPRTATAAARSAEFDRLVKAATQARQAQRWEEAIELYGKTDKIRPDYVEGYWDQGTAYFSLDDHTHCRDAFRRVVRL